MIPSNSVYRSNSQPTLSGRALHWTNTPVSNQSPRFVRGNYAPPSNWRRMKDHIRSQISSSPSIVDIQFPSTPIRAQLCTESNILCWALLPPLTTLHVGRVIKVDTTMRVQDV
ncbi:hypothetical protein TNIN_492121 [Trichonephila inaurata madagascariensis]|uniref:Uncharacterized protein n=1 Tax=Trichonephila inaurata madagascariensis TaxID=2747483 RepID=A0A8X6K3V1_9ARAC|nr:hypothetical protein TNIN_492121 [Trichonephila inaurata madagascariensis]